MNISGFIQHVKKNRCRLIPETQIILFQTVVTHGYKGRKIEEALTKCCPNKFRSMMRQLIKSIPHCPKAYSAGEALRLLLEDFASQRFISPRDIREIILEVSLNNEGRITEIQASYGGTQALFYEDFQEIKLLVRSLSATQLKNLIDELEYHGQNYSIDSLRIDICDTVIGDAEELRFWCNRSKVFLKAGGETQLLSVVKNLTVSHEYCKERISLSTYSAFVERLTLICSKIRENEPIKQLEPLIKKNTSLLYDFYMLEISDIEELFRVITQKDHQKLSELIEGYAIQSQTIQKIKEDLQLCIKHVDQGFKRQYIDSIIKFSKNHLNKKSSIYVSEISNLSSNSEKSKLREQLNDFRTILHFDMRMEDSEIVYLFNRILFHQSTGLQQIMQRQMTKEKYQFITSLKKFLKSIPQEMYQELNLHKNFPKVFESQQSIQQDDKRQFQANKTGQYQMLNYQQNKQQSTPKSSSLIISQRQMIQNQTRAPILLSPLKPAEVYNEKDAFKPIDANIILTQIKLLQKSDDISGMIILLSKDKISKYQIKQLSTNKQIIPLQSNLSFNSRYIKILYFKGKVNGSYWFQICFQSSFFSLFPRKQPKQITLSIKHEDIYINSILFYIDCEQIQPLEGQQRIIYQTARSYALYQSISFVVQKIHVKEDIAKTCIFPWLKIVSEKFKTLELDQQQIFINRQALIQSCFLKSGKSFQSTHFCIYLFCSLYDNRDWQQLLKFQFLSKIILPAQLVPFQNRQYPHSRPFQYFWMKLVLYNDIICPSRKEQSRIKKLLLANMEFLPHDELKAIFQYVAKENIEVLVKMDHQLRQYFLSNLSFSAYEYWKIKMQYIKRIFISQEPSQQQEYLLRFMDDMITMLNGDYKRISENMINQSQNIKMLLMKQGIILFKSPQLRVNDKMIPQLYIKCKIIRVSSNYLLDFVPTILPSLLKNIKKLMQTQFIKLFFSLLVSPSLQDKQQLINLVSKQNCKISSMKSILEKLLQYADADIDYFKILAKEFSKNNGRQTLKILSTFNKLYTNATTQAHKNIFKQLFLIFLKGNITQMRKGMNKNSFENPQSRFIEDIVFYQSLTAPQIQQLYLKQLFCPLIEQFKDLEWIIVMIIDQAFINPDGKNCFDEILHFYLEIIGGLKAKNIQNIIKKYLLKQISNISYLQKYPQQHKKGLELFINNIKSQRFTAPQIRKMHEGTHRFYFQPKSTKALDQAINKLIKFQENVKKAKAFLLKNYSHFKIYIVRLIKYEGRMKLMKLYEAYKLDDRDDFLVDNIAKIELFYKLPVFSTSSIKTDTQLILTFEAVDKLFISELDKIRAQSITYKSFRDWFCQSSSDRLLIQYCVSKELIQAIKRYRALTLQQCKELHDSLKSIQFIEYLIKSHQLKEKVVENDTFVMKLSQNGGQVLLKELQGQIISYKQSILSIVLQSRNIQLNRQQLFLQLQRLIPLEIMHNTFKLKDVFLKMMGIKIDTSIEMGNQQIKIMGNIVLINQYLQLISSCKCLEDFCQNFLTFRQKNEHFEATLLFCIDNQPKIIQLFGLMRKEGPAQTPIVLQQ